MNSTASFPDMTLSELRAVRDLILSRRQYLQPEECALFDKINNAIKHAIAERKDEKLATFAHHIGYHRGAGNYTGD